VGTEVFAIRVQYQDQDSRVSHGGFFRGQVVKEKDGLVLVEFQRGEIQAVGYDQIWKPIDVPEHIRSKYIFSSSED